MVTCTVDQLYSKSNAASDSRTESDSDSDSGGELATQRGKPGWLRNTTLQDTRKKDPQSSVPKHMVTAATFSIASKKAILKKPRDAIIKLCLNAKMNSEKNNSLQYGDEASCET